MKALLPSVVLLASSIASSSLLASQTDAQDVQNQKQSKQGAPLLADQELLLPNPISLNATYAFPPSMDVQIDTRKRVIQLVNPVIQKEVLFDNFPGSTFAKKDLTYRPIRSISFTVSDNVRFLIGSSRLPVQIGFVIALDKNPNSLAQIGIGKRKDFSGIVYQRKF